jgi:RNA polymerase sigma-70 factor, ECF subfamily
VNGLATGVTTMQATAMEQVATGAAEALTREQFDAFYNRTAPALRAYIRRVSGSSSAADDLLQEAYMRLLAAPPLTEAQRKSYLYRTATNLVTDHYRSQTRQRRWWERIPRRQEAVDSPADLPADLERLFLLIATQERALLWLAYVQGEDHRAIAEMLGIKEKSVKVLLHRARVKMEKILKQNGFEGK